MEDEDLLWVLHFLSLICFCLDGNAWIWVCEEESCLCFLLAFVLLLEGSLELKGHWYCYFCFSHFSHVFAFPLLCQRGERPYDI